MAQYGKCTNIGCPKQVANELITIIDGAEFVCPECGFALNPASPRSGSHYNRFIKPVLGVVMTGILGVVISNFFSNTYTVTVITAETGTGKGEVSGNGQFKKGDTVEIKAIPDDKSEVSWSPPLCSASFTMPNNDLTCTATFTLKVKPAPFVPATETASSSQSTIVETPLSLQQIELQREQHLKQGMSYISLAQQTVHKKQRAEQFNNAIAELTKAIDLSKVRTGDDCSNISNIYMNRGSIYLDLNNFDFALEDLKEAEKCDSESGIIQYNIALYYAIKKQDDLSLRSLDNALRVANPVNAYFSKLDRSFCEELKNNSSLKNIKKSKKFKIILEKNNLFCFDL